MIIPSEDNVSRDEILQIMVNATITNTGLGNKQTPVSTLKGATIWNVVELVRVDGSDRRTLLSLVDLNLGG